MSIRKTQCRYRTVPFLLFPLIVIGWFDVPLATADSSDSLVVYSGRAERLIQPVLDVFEKRTGINVQLLTSKTTELVNRLNAEGQRTPADVLITNDAGGLERARQLGLLQPIMPDHAIDTSTSSDKIHSEAISSSKRQMLIDAVPDPYRASDDSWMGLSARFYIVVYNTNLVKPEEIRSILDLADPKWQGKIAIHNAGSEYLQSGVAVIKASHGEEVTRQFLKGVKRNAENHVYGKSSQIVNAVSREEVAMGLVNHYYIYRHLAEDPASPIAALIPDQQEGAMGAILNVAGVAIVKPTKRLNQAQKLVAFLASREGQELFADLNKEYPLNTHVKTNAALPERTTFRAATVPLEKLGELQKQTIDLIEEAGLR